MSILRLQSKGTDQYKNIKNEEIKIIEIKIIEQMLLPGTSIWTSRSSKKLREINRKDKVLTHNGTFKYVDRIIKKPYIGEIIEIKPLKDESIVLTPDHKVVSVKNKDKTFGWIKAKNLENGDKIVFPKLKEKADNFWLNKEILTKQELFENDENYYFIPIEHINILKNKHTLYDLEVEKNRSYVGSMIILAH